MKEIDTGVFTVNNNNDIYIIGDIHGDYQCLIHCLVDLCKTCDVTEIYDDKEFNTKNREKLEWKENNNSTVVFCGDLTDRKRFDHVLDDECSDIYIIKTLLRLKEDAITNGGNIIIISGNHEIMNILYTDENTYVSPANKNKNKEYFNNQEFIKEYIENSYAWIKIGNILIAHGGLCSEYLRFLDNKKSSREIISYVNNEYRKFFVNFKNIANFENMDTNQKKKYEIPYNLFIKYDLEHKKHNIFWCREWGYGKIDCDNFKNILEQVNCEKMIISHCPQFLSPGDPKMINFECLINEDKNNNINNEYLLARIDLGMSRSFDYNKEDKFLDYLSNNYNRKISVLKLLNKKNKLYFNQSSVVTCKISCIQYLLIKYGITQNNWKKNNIISNWIGFNHINNLLNFIKNNKKLKDDYICSSKIICSNENNVLLCLLYQICMKKNDLESIKLFIND